MNKKYNKIADRLDNLGLKFSNPEISGEITFTHEEQISIYKTILYLGDVIGEYLQEKSLPTENHEPRIGKRFEVAGETHTLLAKGTIKDMAKISEVDDIYPPEFAEECLRNLYPNEDHTEKAWLAAYNHNRRGIVYYPEGKNPYEV